MKSRGAVRFRKKQQDPGSSGPREPRTHGRAGSGWIAGTRHCGKLASRSAIGGSSLEEDDMARTTARYGWVPDLPDQRDHLFATPPPVLSALPTSVDLREECPPVYDQAALGSCTANAIAGVLEFDQMKQKLEDIFP